MYVTERYLAVEIEGDYQFFVGPIAARHEALQLMKEYTAAPRSLKAKRMPPIPEKRSMNFRVGKGTALALKAEVFF